MQVSPPSVAGGKEGVGELVGTARQSDTIGVIELELLKLVRHLETFGRRSSPHLDVDRAGYLALRTLESIGPLSTKALADTLHLDASTVTRQIAALEDSGLVERRPDPQDRRSSTIELTPRGRRTMEEVERVRRERMGHIELAVPVSHIWFFKGGWRHWSGTGPKRRGSPSGPRCTG